MPPNRCGILPMFFNLDDLYYILSFFFRFRAFISEPVRKKARGDAPLPDFKWADRQLMWDLMVKRESGVYARLGAAAMLDRHTAVQPKMRAILLGKLGD